MLKHKIVLRGYKSVAILSTAILILLANPYLGGLNIFLFIVFAITYYLIAKKRLNYNNLFTGFLLIAIISFALSSYKYYYDLRIKKHLSGETRSTADKMIADMNGLQNKADSLSSDPFVAQLLQEQNYSQLESYVTNLMVSRRLSYLIISDSLGNVVANASFPKEVGENIFSKHPETKIILRNNTFEIILPLATEQQAYLYGKTLKSQNTKIGFLVAGYIFDSNYAYKLSGQNHDLILSYKNRELSHALNGQIASLPYAFCRKIDCANLTNPARFKYLNSKYVALSESRNINDDYKITATLISKDIRPPLASTVIGSFSLDLFLILLLFFDPKIKKERQHLLFAIRRKPFRNFRLNLFLVVLVSLISIADVCAIYCVSGSIKIDRSKTIHLKKTFFATQYTTNYYKIGQTINYQVLLNPQQNNGEFEYTIEYSPNLLHLENQDLSGSVCSQTNTIENNTNSAIYRCRLAGSTKTRRLISKFIFTTTSDGIANISLKSDQLKNSLDDYFIISK